MGKKIKNLVGVSLFGIALASTIGVSAASTADYYQSIDGGVSGTTLADALNTLVTSTHTHKMSYDNLWSLYGTSDVYPGTNKICDTYSEVLFNKGSDQAGSYQKEGDAYNREHTVPQSWFNENLPMKGDAFHVLATDGYVNNRRGSYLYGEVKNATYTSKNGSKLGSSNLSGYSGTVFEPIDEYKGDIARGYFYMAIRYKDECGSWTSGAKDVFKSTYPYLSDYALYLFTTWSHLVPVSDKELIRNDAIEAEQGNRNPFIDHPEWVDTIWNNSYVDTTTKTAYSALDVIDAVDALQTSSTDADVYNSYAKYCRLNTSDKLLVTNSEALFTKVKSKSGTSMDLSNYWSEIIERNTNTTVVDQDKVDSVIASIAKLPLTITMEDTQNVRTVQQAYAGLNYTERTLVTYYSKLSKAIDTINALESEERVNNVIAMINALPDTITLDDKDAVYNAVNAFMALSFDERCNVTNAEKLTLALQMISALESTIYKQIKNLDELEVGDKVLIVCPTSSYALGGLVSKYYRAGVGVTIKDDEIALPENSEATILTVEAGLTSGTYAFNTGDGYLVPSKEDKYKNLVTEATITEYSSYTVTINDGVANLVSPKAKNGIMAYDTSHYDFTSYETVTGDYTLALFKYSTAGMTVNEEKVNKVIDMINNLPNPLSYTDSELISEIFTAYAALNSLERAEVTN
jgi:endonuclease I